MNIFINNTPTPKAFSSPMVSKAKFLEKSITGLALACLAILAAGLVTIKNIPWNVVVIPYLILSTLTVLFYKTLNRVPPTSNLPSPLPSTLKEISPKKVTPPFRVISPIEVRPPSKVISAPMARRFSSEILLLSLPPTSPPPSVFQHNSNKSLFRQVKSPNLGPVTPSPMNQIPYFSLDD